MTTIDPIEARFTLGSTGRAGRLSMWIRTLDTPVDIAWLAAFRALFGLTMCVSMLRLIGYGWLDDFFVSPRFHFTYWGFHWVTPLGHQGMHALCWTLVWAALAMAVGFGFRLFSAVFFVGLSYLQLIDVTTYLNHYYLASLLAFLLACSPAHRAYSVDAWLDPERARTSVATGWLYLLRFQIAVVYSFAGLAKATSDWLGDAEPLRIWLGSRVGIPILGRVLALPIAAPFMSWAGFLFDSTIAFWLLARPSRRFAFSVVIVFHVVTRLLFPIGMFPFIMVLSALVFFEPTWPQRWLMRAIGRGVNSNSPSGTHPGPPLRAHASPLRSRWALWALYAALQIALPLRFLAYGGNVLWHEQGMRFSWRVMVREKNGSVTFLVRSKTTGRTWEVSPAQYLTRHQEREMSSQPDLILQLAHRIRADAARNGVGAVEVRADAVASLNGRQLARLIDPDVDLATAEDSLGRAGFILPAPNEPPPHVRPARL